MALAQQLIVQRAPIVRAADATHKPMSGTGSGFSWRARILRPMRKLRFDAHWRELRNCRYDPTSSDDLRLRPGWRTSSCRTRWKIISPLPKRQLTRNGRRFVITLPYFSGGEARPSAVVVSTSAPSRNGRWEKRPSPPSAPRPPSGFDDISNGGWKIRGSDCTATSRYRRSSRSLLSRPNCRISPAPHASPDLAASVSLLFHPAPQRPLPPRRRPRTSWNGRPSDVANG